MVYLRDILQILSKFSRLFSLFGASLHMELNFTLASERSFRALQLPVMYVCVNVFPRGTRTSGKVSGA